MTIQDQYHQSRTQPETVAPQPGPLFFFSGVDIAECVRASQRYKRWSDKEHAEVDQLYRLGYSIVNISKKINRTYGSVKTYIYRNIRNNH